MTGMLNDAFIWQSTNDNMQGGEHNEEVENFDRFMEEAKRPLYAGCNKYSRLSFVVHLFQLKCLHKWSNKSFSALLQLLKDVLPDGNVLPSTWYECRKMMSELGLECRKIHACPNDCVLFRNDFENLSKCPKCNASRWKERGINAETRKNVPVKILRHFPLIPRLQRLFMSDVRNDGSNMDTIVSASGSRFNGSHVRIQAPRWQLHAKSFETQDPKVANLGSLSQDRLVSGNFQHREKMHMEKGVGVQHDASHVPNESNNSVEETTFGVTGSFQNKEGGTFNDRMSSHVPKDVVGAQHNTSHVPSESNNSVEETTFGAADAPLKKRRCAQRQRVLMAAITRANDFLESTPTDSSREADRQVHISNEVLDAYYAEINGNGSSRVATSDASKFTVRKTRGPTQETAVLPPKGERWKCLVIDQQPVGKAASKLAIVLGLYARMEGYFPPHKEWNARSHHSFNDVMKDIMRDYDFVDYEGMPANMMDVIRFCKTSLQKKLRDWRCWLKSHYYVEGVPDEVLMKAPDKRVSQVNWDALLKFWESDKKVLEADRNKKNRGEDRATHTLGSKSIARHNQDLREQMGEDYTTLGAYIKAHQTKTGEYPDEYTRVMCEKVIATCMERDVGNSSDPSVLSPILDMVYKRHHGGYERGRGLGWCRTMPLTNMEIEASNENVKHLTIELEKAKAEIEAMHARESEKEARVREREAQQLKEKEEMQVRLQKMEALISMHFCSGSVEDSRVENGCPPNLDIHNQQFRN